MSILKAVANSGGGGGGGGTVTGTGANGELALWSGTTALTGSSAFQWQTGSTFAQIILGAAGKSGGIQLNALTSGSINVQIAGNTVTNYGFFLPPGPPSAGQFFTNGAWATPPLTSPAGTVGMVQWNNSGIFGADGSLFWDNFAPASRGLFGVQTASVPIAAGHFNSAVPITGAAPGVPSVSTVIESDTSGAGGTTTTAPLTIGTYNGAASEAAGSGAYVEAGNSYTYYAYNYYYDGVNPIWYSPVFTTGSFTDNYAPGAVATGSVTINSVPADGDTVTIGDGVNSVTFTFESSGPSTNVVDTSSGDVTIIASNLGTTIATSSPALNITVNAISGSTVPLTNNSTGTAGNVTITQSAGSLSLSGMSGGVDGSMANFSSDFSYSATPTGGNYTGTLLGRQINGGGVQWYDAGEIGSSASIVDDGSLSPYNWGASSGPGTASPDFIGSNQLFSVTLYAIGTSPSGHSYYIGIGAAGFSFPSDGFPYAVSLTNTAGTPLRYQITSPISIFADVPTTSPVTIYSNTSSGPSTTTPNTYGYAPDGTGATPNYYRVIAVHSFGPNIFYTVGSWSSPNFDDASNNWYSTGGFSGAAAASSYILEHSPDGVTADLHANIGLTLSINDDALGVNGTSWAGGGGPESPASYLPPAALFQRDGSDGFPSVIIQDTHSTGGNPILQFQDHAGTVIGTVFASPTLIAIENNTEVLLEAGNSVLALFNSGASYIFSGNFGINTDAPDKAFTVNAPNAGDGAHIGPTFVGNQTGSSVGFPTAQFANFAYRNTGGFGFVHDDNGGIQISSVSGTPISLRVNGGETSIVTNVGLGVKSINPVSLFDLGNAGVTLGTMRLYGSTSGYTQIQPNVAAGSWTLTLPGSPGASGQFLQTNGTGTSVWADATANIVCFEGDVMTYQDNVITY